MPEPMYRALQDIVGLVVDGEYDELRVASGGRLSVEDLHRRDEEDCPEALVLPPRENYQVEAIAKSDDPNLPGWSYFLDLWTDTGPAACTSRAARGVGRGVHGELNDIRPSRRLLAATRRACRVRDGERDAKTPRAPVNAESRLVSGLSAIRRSGGSRDKGTFSEGLALWLPSLSDPLRVADPRPGTPGAQPDLARDRRRTSCSIAFALCPSVSRRSQRRCRAARPVSKPTSAMPRRRSPTSPLSAPGGKDGPEQLPLGCRSSEDVTAACAAALTEVEVGIDAQHIREEVARVEVPFASGSARRTGDATAAVEIRSRRRNGRL